MSPLNITVSFVSLSLEFRLLSVFIHIAPLTRFYRGLRKSGRMDGRTEGACVDRDRAIGLD